MFVLNRWYVAGWSSELSDRPLARTLLNEPVVLFRTADGRAVALEDRCCHRNLPLSHGHVEGNCIACGYHGMVYEPSGQCIKVPGQDVIPTGARVRSFPVFERDRTVLIWPGDPEKADSAQVPAYPIHDDPKWAHRADHYVIKCNHELINDNLIDLSHVGYVHGGPSAALRKPIRSPTSRRSEATMASWYVAGCPTACRPQLMCAR